MSSVTQTTLPSLFVAVLADVAAISFTLLTDAYFVSFADFFARVMMIMIVATFTNDLLYDPVT